MPTLDYQVALDADDGMAQATTFYATGNYNYVGSVGGDCRSFYRFTGVTIPVGATITAAYLTLYEIASGGTPLTKIWGNDTATPTAPTSAATFDGKTLTTAGVDQDGNPAAGEWNTQSLVSIVQELVNSYDYSGGLAMMFLHKNDGGANGNYLESRSFSNPVTTPQGLNAPKLHIEYTSVARFPWQQRRHRRTNGVT